jgi:rRNA-processing protein FCF1
MALDLLNRQQEQFPDQFKSISRNNTRNLPVDDYLITLAESSRINSVNAIYIATNDKEIRNKASLKGIGTIYMRQKKSLEISY